MTIVKLADWSPPLMKPLRFFLLDCDTQEVQELRGKDHADAGKNARGRGGYFRTGILGLNQQFAAIYLCDKKLWVNFDGKRFEVSPDLFCTFDYGAMQNTLALKVNQRKVYSCSYDNTFVDEVDDVVEYIFHSLMSERRRKLFIYLASAEAEGIERSCPEYGYTDDFIDAIADPWAI